ncbi:MAG: hypothetical protein ACK5NX_01355 [Armatimonadota bacterium]
MTHDGPDYEKRATAGAAAQALLESDDYRTAVVEAQNRIMREWAQTEPKDIEGRENLYYEMRALQQVDLSLRLRTEDGQVAQSMLAKARKAIRNLFPA